MLAGLKSMGEVAQTVISRPSGTLNMLVSRCAGVTFAASKAGACRSGAKAGLPASKTFCFAGLSGLAAGREGIKPARRARTVKVRSMREGDEEPV
jgi:hypothetical protein